MLLTCFQLEREEEGGRVEEKEGGKEDKEGEGRKKIYREESRRPSCGCVAARLTSARETPRLKFN